MLVGRLLSYWEASLSGAMLQLAPRFAKKKKRSRQVNHLLMALVFRSAGDLLQRKTGQMVLGFRHLQMGVSKHRGTSKSSILIGFSIINHPFWGPTPIFGSTPKWFQKSKASWFSCWPWSWVTQTMLAFFFSEKVSIKICGNKNQTK